MPCYPPINPCKVTVNCRDYRSSCPVPPHNLSYCKDWSDRVSDVKFWESTASADFQPPDSRVLPNLLPCLDGRIYTRTEINEPKGTPLAGLYKISVTHRDYRPPVGVKRKFPSTEGYREPWKTVICRWCGNTKPSPLCNCECGRIDREEECRLPIHNVIGMYTDCSRENDWGCSPCLEENQLVPVKQGTCIDKDPFTGVCPPQIASCDSPQMPTPCGGCNNQNGMEKPGANKRLVCIPSPPKPPVDVCSDAHIMQGVQEFGTLGGHITQYEADYGESGWWPKMELDF